MKTVRYKNIRFLAYRLQYIRATKTKRRGEKIMPEEFEIISSYTAEEAVEDGILVDVSDTAKELGFVWPVRITQSVHDLCTPPKSNKIQSYNGRLWDVLWMCSLAIKKAKKGDSMVEFLTRIGRKNETLWACLDGTSGMAIHIMKPEDY